MKILLTGSTGMVGKNILEHASAKKKYNILTPTSSDLNLLDKDEIEKIYADQHARLYYTCSGISWGHSCKYKQAV
ncbi:sugar nucleotide-binding protein [Escherichia coli]|uniref:sugar nucleotide-binding protein n=1 Tax=Escherichia coli TaxID=562 RepID=UPI0023797462|nr:sugar nucleotide-binding protein [Escherichia coli]WDN77818.1 sugar nucleotide-binding protein [Escherichia coli]